MAGAAGFGATMENRSRKHEPRGIKAPALPLWLRDRSSTSPQRWSPFRSAASADKNARP